MKKRIFALALALTLLAGLLAGCGGKTAASGSAAASKPAAAGSAEASPLTAKYVYTAQYIDMPAEVSNVNTFALVGGKFYYAAQVADGKATYKDPISSESYDYDVYVTKLFALDLTTEQSQQLAGYTAPTVPEGEQGGANILSMAPGKDDTLWVCDQILTYKYNLPEDFNAETDDMGQYYEEDLNETRLLQLAADGTVKQEIPISGAPEETQTATAASADTYMGGSSISNIVVDDNGYIYTTDYQNVRVYDPQGKQLFSLDVSQQGGDLRRYSGTEVGVTSYDENGISFLPIDIETKTWGEPLKLPQNAYSFYPGDDAYDLYYDYNGNIYGYDKKTDTSEKVVDWLACDVDSNNLQSYQVLPDGRVAGILTDYSAAAAASGSASGNPSTQLVLLTRTEAKDAVRKTVLTLACMGLDWNLRSQIVQFNRTSDQYRIEVQDYSEYNTEKDYTAGLTKLGTEILAGKVPDMLCTNGLPVEQYAAKGILTDLLPLIDADGELTRDSFNQNVMNAILTDGKLYEIPQGFYISTAAGLKKIVGGYDSWTFDSLKDAMTKLPEGASIFNVMYTKNDVLQQFVSQSLGSFVNWDTKTCTFGSPAFVSLLEFAGQFPDTFDSEHFDWQNDYQERPVPRARGPAAARAGWLLDLQRLPVSAGVPGRRLHVHRHPDRGRPERQHLQPRRRARGHVVLRRSRGRVELHPQNAHGGLPVERQHVVVPDQQRGLRGQGQEGHDAGVPARREGPARARQGRQQDRAVHGQLRLRGRQHRRNLRHEAGRVRPAHADHRGHQGRRELRSERFQDRLGRGRRVFLRREGRAGRGRPHSEPRAAVRRGAGIGIPGAAGRRGRVSRRGPGRVPAIFSRQT
jgi:ABC-type glycerol-3-phosphate transport system substrate-binding protein